jgi:hypothetical protein
VSFLPGPCWEKVLSGAQARPRIRLRRLVLLALERMLPDAKGVDCRPPDKRSP